MKKPYVPPAILCETLTPETMLCGCKLKNPTLSEEQHCGYEPMVWALPFLQTVGASVT